jgi:hypothetical protein
MFFNADDLQAAQFGTKVESSRSCSRYGSEIRLFASVVLHEDCVSLSNNSVMKSQHLP